MCFDIFKHGSFHSFSCTASWELCGSSTYRQYIERPFTYPWGIFKGTSHTWLYIGGSLSNDCALDNTTMDLISHVPCVYWETLLGFLYHLRKSLWSSCWSNIVRTTLRDQLRTCCLVSGVFRWGMVDPPHRVLLLDPTVYRKLWQLNNPSERPAIFNSSCHLSMLAALACIGLFVCFFLLFDLR